MRELRNYRLRKMKVQDIDLRADALINTRGNVNPKSNSIVQGLIRAKKARKYLDIGANYGEVIFSINRLRKIEVVAIEPHPRIVDCLKLTCEINKLTINIFNLAVGSKTRNALLIQEDAWSGTSKLNESSSKKLSKENFFPVRVEKIDNLISASKFNTVTKIDVEGHEIEVLAGGPHYFYNLKNWTVLEILHLNQGQIDFLLNNFYIYVFDLRLLNIYQITDSKLIFTNRSKYYLQDAIISKKPLNFYDRILLLFWIRYEIVFYQLMFLLLQNFSKLKKAIISDRLF